MPSLEDWRRYYDGWAGRDPSIASTGHGVSAAELDGLSRWLRGLLPLRGTERVLDVGCASGQLTERWATAAARVVGVDFSEKLLGDAARRGLGERLSLSAAEASALPFATASFDAVVCFNVLVSSPDQDHARATIREILRVAKPGASVVIGSLPDVRCRGRFDERLVAESPWHRRLRARLRGVLVPRGARRRTTRILWYDVEALAAELRALGCDVAVHEDAPFANYRLYRKTLVAVAGSAVGCAS